MSFGDIIQSINQINHSITCHIIVLK